MREKRRNSLAELNSEGYVEREKRFQFRRYLKPILIVTLFVVVFILAVRFMAGQKTSLPNEEIEISGPEKTQEINKEFTFPLKDKNGKEVAKIKYKIEKAELRKEIIVKGQRATAIKGRVFLILNLKIANEFKQPIEINTRDYVRLSVNGNEEEWLAPDIHNDPVEVQAISTKYTRVGFPINESDTNLVIRVGEIEGEKEKIPLSFQ